jgi:hypothetical protein
MTKAELPIATKLLTFVNDEPLTKPPYDSIREAAATVQELYDALLMVSWNSGELSQMHWQRVERALAKARGEQVPA